MWIYLIYSARSKCHRNRTSLTRLALDAPVVPIVLVREAFGGASAVLRVEKLVARTDPVRVELEQADAAEEALDAAVRVPGGGVACARAVDVPAGRAVREERRRGVVDYGLAIELRERLEFGGRVRAELTGCERLGAAYA